MFKTINKKILLILLTAVVFTLNITVSADTFRHRQSNRVIYGYAVQPSEGGKTTVHTSDGGVIALNLAEWDILSDGIGRNFKVIVINLEGDIIYQKEAEAVEKALVDASNQGPLFILIEIDTPGGRVDYAQKICAKITATNNCPIYAYVKGDKYGGALSAGAAIAFACNKIYMAENTTIGAASMIAMLETGPASMKEAFGEEVGEKVDSYWRAYLASLAERNGRPAILASAMVDMNIKAVEVNDGGKSLFVDPINKKSNQQIVHTWTKKGSLLTLTSSEAVRCGIADKLVATREELLRELNASSAEVIKDDALQKARRELNRARLQFNRVKGRLDLKFKQIMLQQPTPKMIKILRDAKSDCQILIKLAQRYPDIEQDTAILEQRLNSIEAVYEKMRSEAMQR